MQNEFIAGHGRFCFFGIEICDHAYRSLLGFGSGRFQKISQAVLQGCDAPPRDARFVEQPHSRKPHDHRVLVAEFLGEIYNTISEPLPEQHGFEVNASSKIPEHEPKEKDPKPRPRLVFRKHRGRRPKVVAHAGRKKKQI